MGAIPYQENEAVLHTDERVLPKRRLAWASWNYHLQREPGSQVPVTYNMNILQGIQAPVQFCVTLNNSQAIDPSKVLKRITYHHPFFSSKAVAAQKRHAEINGMKRTYFCGAYWRFGFHEDGVVSALNALEHFRRIGTMNSCLYEGQVEHRRFAPNEHRFRFPLFLTYLDLDEAWGGVPSSLAVVKPVTLPWLGFAVLIILAMKKSL